ncbi:hypothetical protein C8Q80DRAFT_1276385 [Daedaleopsis nitida]|nr:hypothetical protein C8Q80DRAFT_1276385 [Daedaleopsis nitida]
MADPRARTTVEGRPVPMPARCKSTSTLRLGSPTSTPLALTFTVPSLESRSLSSFSAQLSRPPTSRPSPHREPSGVRACVGACPRTGTGNRALAKVKAKRSLKDFVRRKWELHEEQEREKEKEKEKEATVDLSDEPVDVSASGGKVASSTLEKDTRRVLF